MRIKDFPTCIGPAVLALFLTGCSVIPRDGPASLEVRSKADATLLDTGQLSYAFVNLTPLTVPLFQAGPQPPIKFSMTASAARSADVRIGAGDVIAVSIFEAGGGGLFLPEAPSGRAGSVQLPTQQVTPSGEITVPFAGQVRVLGRTTLEVQQELEEKLRARAIEPQVVVNIVERRSNEIAVLGEVNSPTRFPAEPSGVTLLSALTRAGGSRNPTFETIITIQRGRRNDQALLTWVIKDPSQNINLLPGDVVFVSRQPRVFLAFGATLSSSGGLVGSSNRRYIFEEENLTLTEGVAKAGGLLDDRADARSVFLFRMVPKRTLQKAGVDVSRFAGPLVPTIFNTDWSNPEGMFLANEFYLQHRDIIFVSNAPATDASKILSLIDQFSGTISGVLGTATDIQTFFSR